MTQYELGGRATHVSRFLSGSLYRVGPAFLSVPKLDLNDTHVSKQQSEEARPLNKGLDRCTSRLGVASRAGHGHKMVLALSWQLADIASSGFGLRQLRC